MPYTDDEMLQLSGIQHYVFCPRQWALIAIEQIWADNHLTLEGTYRHENIDDPCYRQLYQDRIALHGVNLSSRILGFNGIADVVELLPTDRTTDIISHPIYPYRFIPYPVEYKHGIPKKDKSDIMQLVAQTMCLEEAFGIEISEGALFYWKTRRRLAVNMTQSLRDEAKDISSRMHSIMANGVMPEPTEEVKKCYNCSLKDICVPDINRRQSPKSYLTKRLYEETS